MTDERRLEIIPLSMEQLHSLIHKVFPEKYHVDEWRVLSGGAVNSLYLFSIGDTQYVLRLYARGRDFCRIEKEVYALIKGKIPIPQMIYSDPEHDFYPYAIFQYVPGISISDAPSDSGKSLSYELGSVLAQIHSFSFPGAGLFENGLEIGFPFPEGSSPYFEASFDILETASQARLRLGDEFADSILAFIERNQDFFPQVGPQACLTHADFKPMNLLYNEHGKVVVLDWEFVHAGMGILDFAILLRHRNKFPLDLHYLEKGYREQDGKLPEEWLRMALMTDFVNIMFLLNNPAEQPRLFEELKQGLNLTMKNWGRIGSLFKK